MVVTMLKNRTQKDKKQKQKKQTNQTTNKTHKAQNRHYEQGQLSRRKVMAYASQLFFRPVPISFRQVVLHAR